MDYLQIIWLVAIVVFLIIEVATQGLTTIWFAGGAVVALVLSLFDLHPAIQVVAFIVVSVLLLILTRPIAIKHLNTKRTATNAESLIGKSGVVIEEINNVNATGRISVDGQEWAARSVDENVIIALDNVVNIKDIQGVKLIVENKR